MLDYLVRLTEPVGAHDDAGPGAPGWWTNDAPAGQPDVSGGHADLGMAHGISGPLALLALAMRRDVTVAGHAEAIDRICGWLDTWRQQAPAGPWWPERLSLTDHGWAGLAATVWYAATDATTTNLDARLPLLLRALIDRADEDITSTLPGLIEGRAGVALTLHTIATATSSGWPACLLIN